MIYNNTGFEQHLNINGVRWRVRKGKSFAAVPHGPVVVGSVYGLRTALDDWKGDERGSYVEYRI